MRGLWLTADGLHGAVLDETVPWTVPLLACGALTRIDVLGLMAHVPGWEPDEPANRGKK